MTNPPTVTDCFTHPVFRGSMERHGPITELTVKVNTYIVEAALRNAELQCLYAWLWVRAVDIKWNGNATGRVYGIKRLVDYLAGEMKVCTRTVRRHLESASANGYLTVVEASDRIEVPSRARLTLWLWRQDQAEGEVRGRTLPDMHMRHPGDVLALNVKISDVWAAGNSGKSRSLAIGIVRQRATEYGWCRETVARLCGMERTSTARLDRQQSVKRGWQYAYLSMSEITHHCLSKEQEEVFGRELEVAYSHTRSLHSGRGRKIWFGTSPDGKAAIFTQLPVKWSTPFAGRFKEDVDFKVLVEQEVSPAMLAGCSALRSIRTVSSSTNAEISNTTLSESMRESLWRLLSELSPSLDPKVTVNLKPSIQISDHIGWSRWTAQSPNSITPDQKDQTYKERVMH